MGEQPAHRVSLRAVAEQAECDPALINYYFGGKAGLLSAVLSEAAQELTAKLETAYEAGGSVEQGLRAAISDPITVLAESPFLPQLIIEQLVLSDDQEADAFLDELATPYLGRIIELVEEGINEGQLRAVDPRLLVYTLSALPLFFYLLAPLFRRIFDDQTISVDVAEHFADGLTDLILHGVLAQPPKRASKPSRR
jgi:AcrR family transcriptional regulator